MLLSPHHPNKAHTCLHQTAITTWKRSAAYSSNIIYIKLRQAHMLSCTSIQITKKTDAKIKRRKTAFFFVNLNRNKPNSVISMVSTGSFKSKSMHNNHKFYQQISNTKVNECTILLQNINECTLNKNTTGLVSIFNCNVFYFSGYLK